MSRPRKYATDEERRAVRTARRRELYHTDPEARKRRLASNRRSFLKRRHTDPEFRKKVSQQAATRHRERYHTDPEYRARCIASTAKAHMKRYSSDPIYRKKYLEKRREAHRKWVKANPEKVSRYLAEKQKRQTCNKLVDAALDAKDDPDSLFHNVGLTENLVGVSCPRLQKIADAHMAVAKRGKRCLQCGKFSPRSSSYCVSCGAVLDPVRKWAGRLHG